MNNQPEYYNNSNNQGPNPLMGYLFVLMSIFMLGIMFYLFINSSHQPVTADSPTKPTPTMLAVETETPIKTPAETPKMPVDEPPKTQTPEPAPERTSKPLKPKEEEIEFTGVEPDDAPDMEKAIGDMFQDTKARVYVIVYSRLGYGDKAYIIDKRANNYRFLKFDEVEPDKYKVSLPPGDYTLKLIKRGYFTFT
ncbi:MAG: hypothetical protein ACLFQV_05560, partial [Vulcanimicrobiota bacterium]